MPSGSFRQADVQCPFYQYDDGRRRITCEGIVDGSSIAFISRTRELYETQMVVFCCEHYRKCEIYRMLMENKYAWEELSNDVGRCYRDQEA